MRVPVQRRRMSRRRQARAPHPRRRYVAAYALSIALHLIVALLIVVDVVRPSLSGGPDADQTFTVATQQRAAPSEIVNAEATLAPATPATAEPARAATVPIVAKVVSTAQPVVPVRRTPRVVPPVVRTPRPRIALRLRTARSAVRRPELAKIVPRGTPQPDRISVVAPLVRSTPTVEPSPAPSTALSTVQPAATPLVATPRPTRPPTPTPSIAPTVLPSVPVKRTARATSAPTLAATPVRVARALAPTAAPTRQPTPRATLALTVQPNARPTPRTTPRPTAQPTALPTAPATNRPTAVPTATSASTLATTVPVRATAAPTPLVEVAATAVPNAPATATQASRPLAASRAPPERRTSAGPSISTHDSLSGRKGSADTTGAGETARGSAGAEAHARSKAVAVLRSSGGTVRGRSHVGAFTSPSAGTQSKGRSLDALNARLNASLPAGTSVAYSDRQYTNDLTQALAEARATYYQAAAPPQNVLDRALYVIRQAGNALDGRGSLLYVLKKQRFFGIEICTGWKVENDGSSAVGGYTFGPCGGERTTPPVGLPTLSPKTTGNQR